MIKRAPRRSFCFLSDLTTIQLPQQLSCRSNFLASSLDFGKSVPYTVKKSSLRSLIVFQSQCVKNFAMALSFYNLNLSKKMAFIFKKSFNKKNNIKIQIHQKKNMISIQISIKGITMLRKHKLSHYIFPLMLGFLSMDAIVKSL